MTHSHRILSPLFLLLMAAALLPGCSDTGVAPRPLAGPGDGDIFYFHARAYSSDGAVVQDSTVADETIGLCLGQRGATFSNGLSLNYLRNGDISILLLPLAHTTLKDLTLPFGSKRNGSVPIETQSFEVPVPNGGMATLVADSGEISYIGPETIRVGDEAFACDIVRIRLDYHQPPRGGLPISDYQQVRDYWFSQKLGYFIREEHYIAEGTPVMAGTLPPLVYRKDLLRYTRGE